MGKRGWMFWYEIIGIGVYWFWFSRLVAGCDGWANKLGFVLLSHMAASPTHVQVEQAFNPLVSALPLLIPSPLGALRLYFRISRNRPPISDQRSPSSIVNSAQPQT